MYISFDGSIKSHVGCDLMYSTSISRGASAAPLETRPTVNGTSPEMGRPHSST